MDALIQKIDGQFPNLNFFQADKGFKELGYHVTYFSWKSDRGFWNEHEAPIALDSGTVVVGGIPVMNAAYKELGIKNPFLSCYPVALTLYMRRKVGVMEMKEVRETFIEYGENPIFIKPLDAYRKSFNGYLIKTFRDLTYTAAIPDEDFVYWSEPLSLLSEYRVFVHHNTIVGMKHYKGDYMTFPDPDMIQLMVDDFSKDAPVAYSLDIGVSLTEEEEAADTVLVEVNDATCLGCYGLEPTKYAKMISSRWDEIVDIKTLQVL